MEEEQPDALKEILEPEEAGPEEKKPIPELYIQQPTESFAITFPNQLRLEATSRFSTFEQLTNFILSDEVAEVIVKRLKQFNVGNNKEPQYTK